MSRSERKGKYVIYIMNHHPIQIRLPFAPFFPPRKAGCMIQQWRENQSIACICLNFTHQVDELKLLRSDFSLVAYNSRYGMVRHGIGAVRFGVAYRSITASFLPSLNPVRGTTWEAPPKRAAIPVGRDSGA